MSSSSSSFEQYASATQTNLVKVIEALSRSAAPVTLKEIGQAAGLPYPQSRGAVASAVATGWVISRQGTRGQVFQLTPKFFALALQQLLTAAEAVRAPLLQAQALLEATSHLGKLFGLSTPTPEVNDVRDR